MWNSNDTLIIDFNYAMTHSHAATLSNATT
jgi:hypothetical protein